MDTLFVLNVFVLGFAGLVTVAYTVARNGPSLFWKKVNRRIDRQLIRVIDWVILRVGGTPPHRGKAL